MGHWPNLLFLFCDGFPYRSLIYKGEYGPLKDIHISWAFFSNFVIFFACRSLSTHAMYADAYCIVWESTDDDNTDITREQQHHIPHHSHTTWHYSAVNTKTVTIDVPHKRISKKGHWWCWRSAWFNWAETYQDKRHWPAPRSWVVFQIQFCRSFLKFIILFLFWPAYDWIWIKIWNKLGWAEPHSRFPLWFPINSP